ncbi:uncharacterized protein LACBIDRAFT_330281 [Laccaria bicolor S238N-H82]|uniref:Predicted protein n=1 Tax=Laccaria bicolor (strain S238N-H82 / ATCC MYA-4686) TaxID=486041 RepID=B0DKS7_LACBS|nr:uncharacterized protein LACBIDRAFT_330281 [Laccaria bicolor S238N-H82]EDR04792.1 predicted protein [Laccaria bicolor S238N-H82]|eukprot:XP_001884616.1 predicted protein [Laccaria bicolor S238N-H82]
MFNGWKEATKQVLKAQEYERELHSQNSRLEKEVLQLRGELQVQRTGFRFGPHIVSKTQSDSISPSNSVSQIGSGSILNPVQCAVSQPSIQPPHYSHKILWTLEDCQKDLHNVVTKSNKSRPAMEKAIQHEDSTLINGGEWHAIKANARAIASCDLLPLPIPCDTPSLVKKKTKTFFTKYHLKQWTNTVHKLEEQEPLLALCAAHWKAEHVLNTILTGITESNQNTSTRRDDASDLDDPAVSLPDPSLKNNTSSSKRRLSNPSPTKQKKKKKTGKEKGTKDSEKASPPSITIDDDAINRQLNLSTENAGTAAAATEPQDKPNSSPDLAIPPIPLTLERIDINFIDVNPSYSSLKDKFSGSHHTNTVAIELLTAFEADPDFQSGEPSQDTLSFLDRIETADPNSPDFSEDDLYGNWGHYQFTAGSRTISMVLTSWKSVGNTSVACDIYIELLVDKLLDLWKDAGGSISKGKGMNKDSALGANLPTSDIIQMQAPSTQHAEPEAMLIDTTASSSGELSESAVKTASVDVRKILQALQKDELKAWINDHNINTPSGTRTKDAHDESNSELHFLYFLCWGVRMDAYKFSFHNSQIPNGHSCPSPNPSLFLSPLLQPNPGPLPVPQPLHVENLSLSDLLKNREVLDMFNGWKEATKQVLKAQEYERELHSQNSRLEKEVLQLRGELQVQRTGFRFGPHIVSKTQSDSISPSNSVSQIGSGSILNPVQCAVSQPSIQPPHYSHKILWTLEDCQKDLHNVVTKSNKSRPAMEKAIQHEDSTLINGGEWHAIKANARAIASCDLLPLPIPCDTPSLVKKKTKTFFTKYHLKQWTNTVHKLEEQEPLLALCAAHWKAEHVLNTILTGITESNQNTSTRRDDASDLDDPAVSLPDPSLKNNTSSSKRRLSNPSPTKQKKKKKTGKEKGTKDSEKASPPSITIDDDAINRQLNLSTENAGTAAAATEPQDKPNSSPDLAIPPIPLTLERIDINFIDVNPSYSSLKDKFSGSHHTNTVAIELLTAFEADPDFQSGEPSQDTLSFLDRIETADPNSPDFSEDDLYGNWGHYQFTAGSRTISMVLTSWKSVGNTSVACDIYIELLVDKLLDLWKDAGGSISKGKGMNKDSALGANLPTSDIIQMQAPSTQHAEPEAMLIDTTASSSGELSESAVKTASVDVRKILQALQKDELKAWINDHNINTPSGTRTKDDLIVLIVGDGVHEKPSSADVKRIVEAHKGQKGATKASTSKA